MEGHEQEYSSTDDAKEFFLESEAPTYNMAFKMLSKWPALFVDSRSSEGLSSLLRSYD